MSLLRGMVIAFAFLKILGGGVFAMKLDVSVGGFMEGMYREEQALRGQMWGSEGEDKTKIAKKVSLFQNLRHVLVEYVSKAHQPVSIKLPSDKKIENLSDTQKEAVVAFELFVSDSCPYLLYSAVNILSEEKENSDSMFILGEILKSAPREFLEGF